MNLAGIFVREVGIFMKPENKGRFYRDGRFATLLDVVNSYNARFNLGLTTQEKKRHRRVLEVTVRKAVKAPGQRLGQFEWEKGI